MFDVQWYSESRHCTVVIHRLNAFLLWNMFSISFSCIRIQQLVITLWLIHLMPSISLRLCLYLLRGSNIYFYAKHFWNYRHLQRTKKKIVKIQHSDSTLWDIKAMITTVEINTPLKWRVRVRIEHLVIQLSDESKKKKMIYTVIKRDQP